MPTFKNYDPDQHVLIIGGFVATGLADGTPISIERDEDSASKKTGIGGDTIKQRKKNRNGKATVMFLYSSPMNDVLSGYIIADEAPGADLTAGNFDFLLKDLNSNTVVASGAAWVERWTNVDVGDEAPNREWTIALTLINQNVGGAIS